MPIAPNMVDPVVWCLYDTIVTAAGNNTLPEYQFFNGIGNRTKAATNVEQPQTLPDPQWFNVWSIGFQFATNMLKADIDLFLRSYYYEFWVGEKVYAEGPLETAPSGVGLHGATAVTNEAAWSNGLPTVHNLIDLRLPPPLGDGIIGITILQGQRFRVKVIGTAFQLTAAANGGTGLFARCYLFGVLSRGVQ